MERERDLESERLDALEGLGEPDLLSDLALRSDLDGERVSDSFFLRFSVYAIPFSQAFYSSVFICSVFIFLFFSFLHPNLKSLFFFCLDT